MLSFENLNYVCTCLLDFSGQVVYRTNVSTNTILPRGEKQRCWAPHKLFYPSPFTWLLQEAQWHNSSLCIEKSAAPVSFSALQDCYRTATFFYTCFFLIPESWYSWHCIQALLGFQSDMSTLKLQHVTGLAETITHTSKIVSTLKLCHISVS